MFRVARTRSARRFFAVIAVVFSMSLLIGQTVSAAPEPSQSTSSVSNEDSGAGGEAEPQNGTSQPGSQDPVPTESQPSGVPTNSPDSGDKDGAKNPAAMSEDDAPVEALDASLLIDKSVSQGSVTVDSGFSYIIHVSCSVSGGDSACENLTIKDTIPEGFVLDPVPADIVGVRDVEYDAVTRELTVTYLAPIDGGSSVELILPIKVPATANFPDGSQVPNTATANADNADEVEDSVNIVVLNPAKPAVETGKSWSPASIVAQSGASTQVTLTPANVSSTSTQVSELSVVEADVEVANTFDFGPNVTIDRWPAGANTLTVYACTVAPPAACSDADFTTVAGTTTAPGSSLNLADAANYTGLKFTFTDSDGNFLPTDTSGADIKFDLVLRDNYRDGSGSITPESDLTVHNSAVPSIVVENSGTPEIVTGDEAVDKMVILSDQLKLESSKDYYSAKAGTYDPDPSHPAVAGENSPVAIDVQVQNTSAFPINEITLNEPVSGQLTPFVPTNFAVSLPDNADEAEVTWTCSEGGTPTPAAGTIYTSDQADVAVSCSSGVPVSVSITYSSSTGEILPESDGGSPAGLKLRGELDGSQGEGPLPNTVGYTGASDTKEASGEVSDILEVVDRQGPGGGSFDKSTGGVQTIIPGQPLDYTVTFRNNGNIPLAGVTVSDPHNPDPANPSNQFGLLGHLDLVSVSMNAPAEGDFKLEVYDPSADNWVEYSTVSPITPGDFTGVRVISESGLLPVGGTVTLHIKVQLKDPPPLSLTPIENCATVEYEDPQNPGVTQSANSCRTVLAQGPDVGGTVAKHIIPTETVRPEPGIPAESVQVLIPVTSQGTDGSPSSTLYLKQLYATDVDKDFFDAVDFDNQVTVNRPPGATHTKVDLCRWGADCDADPVLWEEGAWSTSAHTPPVPNVGGDKVGGIRVTFSTAAGDSGPAEILPVENFPSGGACPGAAVCFAVKPRQYLYSNGSVLTPDHVDNTASAGGKTEPRDGAPDGDFEIGDASAGLELTHGWRKLDIEETPKHTLVAPGATHIFNTEIKSTGTGSVLNPTFINPIPSTLILDDSFGLNQNFPFTVTYDLAPGSPAPPDIEDLDVELLASGSTYRQIKVTWPNWSFTPESKINIAFRYTPAPGVRAGDILVNPVGVTGTNYFSTTTDPIATPDNTCEQPNETSSNFGVNPTPDHMVCLSDASIEITSGNALLSRKYVAGNSDLGFYNTLTEEYVPVDNPGSCLTYQYEGTSYVQFPCIALIYPGEKYKHIMGLRNAGTNDLQEIRIVDGLPVEGDTSLLSPNPRGTQWSPRPTLDGEVVTPISSGHVDTTYSTNTNACVAVLETAAGVCDYSSTFPGEATGSFYSKWDLRGTGEALVPGGTLGLQMPMNSPVVLEDAPNDMPIAWNSMADTAWATYGSGEMKLLQSEPTKSGIAMLLGDLVISKKVNGKAKDVPNPTSFDIRYKCSATPEGGVPQVVADETVAVDGGKSIRVSNLPARAICKVWEPNPKGGNSDAPSESEAKIVTIPPSSGPNPTPQVSVQINNTFGTGKVRVRKKLEGEGADEAKGPWKFALSCTYDNQKLPIRMLTAKRKKMSPVAQNLPVGAECALKETTTKGLAKKPEITPSNLVVSSKTSSSTFTVINTYKKSSGGGSGDGGGTGNGGAGDGSGNLPGTGAGAILALLLAGLAAIGGGVYLVRRSRMS